MDEAYLAALRTERDGVRISPDRDAKWRRLAELTDLIGDEPLETDQPTGDDLENAADSTPLERTVPRRGGRRKENTGG